MFKKKRKVAGLILIGFIFLGLVIYFGYNNLLKQEFLGGATVLSVDNIQAISSSPELDFNDAFLVNLVVDRGGESLSGTITAETFKQFGIDESKIPDGSFKIDINLISNSCNYQIIDDKTTIPIVYQAVVKYGHNTPQCGGSPNPFTFPGEAFGQATCPYDQINLETVKANCRGEWGVDQEAILRPTSASNPEICRGAFGPTGTQDATIGATPDIGDVCNDLIDLQAERQFNQDASEWCYSSLPESCCGSYADTLHWRVIHLAQYPLYQGFRIDDSSFYDFSVNFTITTADGNKYSTTINPNEKTKFLEDIARIKYVGSLVGSQSCPAPYTNTAIVKDLRNEKFKEADKNNYDGSKDNVFELVNLDNNLYEHSGTDPGQGFADITSRISSNNARVTDIFNQEDFREDCWISKDGIQYKCETQNDVIYPEFQLLIRADALGVILPSGIPKIQSINVPKSYEGDINKLEFTIKNEADEDDTFNVYAICETVDIDISSKKIPTEAQKTSDGVLEVNGPIGEFTCTLFAESVNNPYNKDAKEFKIDFKQKPLSFEKTQPDSGINGKKINGFKLLIIIVIALAIILSVLGVVYKKQIKRAFK
ncbi:MAG: hypothetical protein Q8P20_07855 [bacterium]|nr:hypothetical protein [bacterium]